MKISLCLCWRCTQLRSFGDESNEEPESHQIWLLFAKSLDTPVIYLAPLGHLPHADFQTMPHKTFSFPQKRDPPGFDLHAGLMRLILIIHGRLWVRTWRLWVGSLHWFSMWEFQMGISEDRDWRHSFLLLRSRSHAAFLLWERRVGHILSRSFSAQNGGIMELFVWCDTDQSRGHKFDVVLSLQNNIDLSSQRLRRIVSLWERSVL